MEKTLDITLQSLNPNLTAYLLDAVDKTIKELEAAEAHGADAHTWGVACGKEELSFAVTKKELEELRTNLLNGFSEYSSQ